MHICTRQHIYKDICISIVCKKKRCQQWNCPREQTGKLRCRQTRSAWQERSELWPHSPTWMLGGHKHECTQNDTGFQLYKKFQNMQNYTLHCLGMLTCIVKLLRKTRFKLILICAGRRVEGRTKDLKGIDKI